MKEDIKNVYHIISLYKVQNQERLNFISYGYILGGKCVKKNETITTTNFRIITPQGRERVHHEEEITCLVF